MISTYLLGGELSKKFIIVRNKYPEDSDVMMNYDLLHRFSKGIQTHMSIPSKKHPLDNVYYNYVISGRNYIKKHEIYVSQEVLDQTGFNHLDKVVLTISDWPIISGTKLLKVSHSS